MIRNKCDCAIAIREISRMQRISPRPTRVRFFMLFGVLCAVWAVLPLDAAKSSAPVEPSVVLLETFDVPIILEHSRYFTAAMQQLGYRSAQIRTLKAHGDPQRARRLLSEE